ncbi:MULTISPECIES: acyl-CoA thioesterase [unclassified Paenibacillus]|uniref:acyl-CoA thioesterase n=1 Tax=unclassified Paenibacillus TaxID=185978 RepID=UPI000953D9C5|nr:MULTISPECIES: acyl-CoA thioesterase [unclassified Paenibacillus]ASS68289.1 acyl-CoA thioesterase [Paenibacillus sp. RUD330]SIR27644.1 Acyl-CoA hydrolase [Paenibacillus sp. RU4X]SIR40202.1 Acyl-CoA hydrolase [Paenibacillus sp. RU4T]
MQPSKFVRQSRCFKTARIFPPDVNNHQTMFGGKLMAYIDDIASIAAMKHCRMPTVTASTDSVDFLHPIRPTDSITMEAYVAWSGRSSMEVFVKIVKEDLMSGERMVAATAFLTFVAMGPDKRPAPVPDIVPETEEEKKLFESAPARAEIRRRRRQESKRFADFLGVDHPWE